MSANRRPGWGWLVALTTAILLALTLSPQGEVRGINLMPLEQIWRATRNVFASPRPLEHPTLPYLLWQVAGNVVAFIPFGFTTAGWLRGPTRLGTVARAIGWGFLLSLAIELTQLLMATRATDVDDLIFNTFGTAIGALLLVAVVKAPSARRSSRTGRSPAKRST